MSLFQPQNFATIKCEAIPDGFGLNKRAVVTGRNENIETYQGFFLGLSTTDKICDNSFAGLWVDFTASNIALVTQSNSNPCSGGPKPVEGPKLTLNDYPSLKKGKAPFEIHFEFENDGIKVSTVNETIDELKPLPVSTTELTYFVVAKKGGAGGLLDVHIKIE